MVTLANALKLSAEHPDQYQTPSAADKAPLRPGNIVKIRFESQGWIEGMWVRITHRHGQDLQGTLENAPFLLDAVLARGDTITFSLDNILDIEN